MRYALRTNRRSALGASGSSHHRTISHETIAKKSRETVYTFSFTTDWFHTANAVAPVNTATDAPTIRRERSLPHPPGARSVIRNHAPADSALHSAASMLIRTATDGPIGNSEKNRPM